MLDTLILIVVIASSAWVLVDARSIGVQKGQVRGIANMGPVAWFIVCLLLWLIAFSMYLAKRPEYKRVNGKDGSNTGATLVGLAVVAAVVLSIVLAVTGDIKLSTSDLQVEVEQSIRETWAKEPSLFSTKIHSFALVHKAGNQYEGLLDTTIDGERNNLVIDVTYDGEKFMWQVRQ